MFCFHLYYFCIFDDCKYFCLASKSPKKKPPKNENIELKQTIGKLIEKIILFLFLYFGFKQSNLNFLFKKKEQYIFTIETQKDEENKNETITYGI